MPLANLEDLRKHLNLPDSATYDDDELQQTLDAAIDLVVSMVGGFAGGSVSELVPVYGDMALMSQIPDGVVTVTTESGSPIVGFRVQPAARVVYGVYGQGLVRLQYSSGSANVPAAVKLATLMIAAQLWATQRVPGANRPGYGSGASEPVAMGFAVPNRAKELLAPYMNSSWQIA